MNPSEDEIKKAAIDLYGNDSHTYAKQRDGFFEGAKWALGISSFNKGYEIKSSGYGFIGFDANGKVSEVEIIKKDL